jgi:putative ABC transport system permease protein
MPRKSIFFDIVRISLYQVYCQRRRYLGVVLAIALGTAGFIVIATMGRDVKKNLNADLDLLGGATLIRAYLDPYLPTHKYSKYPEFTLDTIEAMKSLPGVQAVSVIVFKPTAISTFQKEEVAFPLIGADGFFWSVNSFTPVSGSFFNADDVAKRRRVCVLGTRLAKKIFGRTDVVGQQCQIGNESYRVSGILGGVAVGDLVEYGFVPITSAESFVIGLSFRQKAYIRCVGWDDVSKVAAVLPDVVHAHQVTDSLRVDVRWEELKRVQRVAWWVELFIYLSTAATLILGGFGIWNGMMATVKSRKTEIGLKKAMGAEDRDILAQFMIEALSLSFASALLGGFLGRGAMEIVGHLMKSRASDALFFTCVGLALFFSLILGAGAGFYPSLRASRMEVVDALRYE